MRVLGDPREARTFPQLIRAAARAYGDATALEFEGDTIPSKSVTYAELDARSAELARGLIARGIGKGSRVGYIFGNGPGFATCSRRLPASAAVAVPISTMIRANELVRVLRQSDIAGLILQRKFMGYDYADRLRDALPELASCGPELRIARVPFLRWIVSAGDGLPASIQPMEFLTAAAASVPEELLREAESEVHPADQMVEIYTSGSMALPKGVKHLHGPVMFRANYLSGEAKFEPGKETYAMLPMFWIGGLMMYLVPNWMAGGRTRCTEKTLANSQVAMGSVLAPDDVKLMGNNKPYWGLGMSETIGPYTYGDELRIPGYPMCAPMDHIAPRYEVRIADENDQPVADGGVGEMQVRGYPVTPGLHKIERAEFFTADGYYHTGDMCLVQGSRILFVGRGGDMIKTASSNVSPAEVEEEMQSLDGVHNAYVVGLPDQERGQLVVAAVVAREGAKLDFGAIEAELRKRLSGYKVPRAYVEITREEVPVLHSNKVSRRMVEKLMAEKLGRG